MSNSVPLPQVCLSVPRDWLRHVQQRHGQVVVIEMLNAMNALSSSESLLTFFLGNNPMLIYAITLSMLLHFAILYIPFLQNLFSILPMDWNEWQAVLVISAPVM